MPLVGSVFNRVQKEAVRSRGHTWQGPGSVNPGILDARINEIAKWPKFLLTQEAMEVASAMSIDAICKTIQDLGTMDLLHMPSDQLIIQRNVKGEDGEERIAFFAVEEFVIADNPRKVPPAYKTEPHMGHCWEITCFLELRRADGRPGWNVLPICFSLFPQAGNDQILMSSHNQSWWVGERDGHGLHEFLAGSEKGEKWKSIVLRTIMHFVILLQTRGISKDPVDVPPARPSRLGRLIKSRKDKQDIPRYSHTVVDLAPELRGLVGKTYRTATGRASPRLHLRLGHIHTFRYGPGRSQSYQKMLPSMMVGLSERGEVTHDYEIKAPRSAGPDEGLLQGSADPGPDGGADERAV